MPTIRNIQRAIYLGCSAPLERRSYSPYLRYLLAGENTLKKLGLSRTTMNDPTHNEILVNLARLNRGFSARETRNIIINATKNNSKFIELMSILKNTEPANLSTNDVVLNREEFCKEYLRCSVIYTSGPGPLTLEVCGDIFYAPEKMQDIMTHSYQYYGLDNAFKSNNFKEAATGSSSDLSWLKQPSKTNAAGLLFFSQQNDEAEPTSGYCCNII